MRVVNGVGGELVGQREVRIAADSGFPGRPCMSTARGYQPRSPAFPVQALARPQLQRHLLRCGSIRFIPHGYTETRDMARVQDA